MKKSALIQKGNRAEKALNITLLVINQKGLSLLPAPPPPSAHRVSVRFFASGPCHIYIEVLSAKGLKLENVSI